VIAEILYRDESRLEGRHHGFDAVGHGHFSIDGFQGGFDVPAADAQGLAYFWIRESSGKEVQDLQFVVGQVIRRGGGVSFVGAK